MNDWVRQSKDLRAAADRLLADAGLLDLLGKYGTVMPTGSYHYDLMTWRDVDLCLVVDDVSPETACDLAKRIAAIPRVGSMYYRNELVMQTPGNPRAIFLCVDFYLPDKVKWKVDILISDSTEVHRVLDRGETFMARLTPETREAIVRIKSEVCRRAEYRSTFSSKTIYDAVLDEGVRTVDEWEAWFRKREARQTG